MSVWTRDELEAQIAATKAAIQKATPLRQQEARASGPGGSQLTSFRSLDELRQHLAYLVKELRILDHGGGITTVPMIPRRL